MGTYILYAYKGKFIEGGEFACKAVESDFLPRVGEHVLVDNHLRAVRKVIHHQSTPEPKVIVDGLVDAALKHIKNHHKWVGYDLLRGKVW